MTDNQPQFDVFLAHNTEDKFLVKSISNELKRRGLNPWLDEEQIQPGRPFLDEIERAISEVKSAAIFIGLHGIGKFQRMELRALISECVSKNIPVIPVLLSDVSELPSELCFLKQLNWVTFPKEINDENALNKLEWGITGKQPGKFLKSEQKPGKVPTTKLIPPTISPSINKTFQFETVKLQLEKDRIKSVTRTCQIKYFIEDLGFDIALEMIEIPGGRFAMGSAPNEKESINNERPIHQVIVEPFCMGKYLITQEQWERVANSFPLVNKVLEPRPSTFKGGEHLPVEQVSWFDAVEFCDRLARETSRPYRLPSEAEWEYACRAGTATPFYFGETITADVVNYNEHLTYNNYPEGVYTKETTPVMRFSPNAFGLYDMHGNLLEWCADNWHENYEGAPMDGSAWLDNNNQFRVLRGGSWFSSPEKCRSAHRSSYYPDDRDWEYGFRVVCKSMF